MAAAQDDALFPLEPLTAGDPVVEEERGPVARTVRPYEPQQILLRPPSLDDWLPGRNLVRFVGELVEKALDLSDRWQVSRHLVVASVLWVVGGYRMMRGEGSGAAPGPGASGGPLRGSDGAAAR